MKHAKRIVWGTTLMLACVAGPVAAQSFGIGGYGARAGWVVPEHLDGTFTLGGHIELARPGSRFHVQPSVMYWNEDGVSDLNPNLDLYYHFSPEGWMAPYVGGGLGIHFIADGDSHSDVGANLFGGLRFPAAGSDYFVEGRFSATDVSQFAILGGITLPIR